MNETSAVQVDGGFWGYVFLFAAFIGLAVILFVFAKSLVSAGSRSGRVGSHSPVTAGGPTPPTPAPSPPKDSGGHKGGRDTWKIVAIVVGVGLLLLVLWRPLKDGFCELAPFGFCEVAGTRPEEYTELQQLRRRQVQSVADVPPQGGEIDLLQCGSVGATLESCPRVRSEVIQAVPGYKICRDADYGSLSFAGEYRYEGDVWLPVPPDTDDDGTPDVQYLSREERFVSTTDRGQKLRYWYVRPGTSCRRA